MAKKTKRERQQEYLQQMILERQQTCDHNLGRSGHWTLKNGELFCGHCDLRLHSDPQLSLLLFLLADRISDLHFAISSSDD